LGHNMFRVTRLVALSGKFDQLKYRKAVSAMSVCPVDHRWLASNAGLSRGEALALLRQLQREGALAIVPPLAGPAREPMPTSATVRPDFKSRMRQWLLGGGLIGATSTHGATMYAHEPEQP
jgi:hypothetical protein